MADRKEKSNKATQSRRSSPDAYAAIELIRDDAVPDLGRDQSKGRDWLGARVRRLRKEGGRTLRNLSESTGLAVSTLSKIENGHLSVSFDKLMLLAQGLDVDISTLLWHEGTVNPNGRRSVTRKGCGDPYRTPQYSYELLCNDLARKQIVPLRAKIHARSLEGFGSLIRHPGEEFLYILDGAIELHTEFYEPLVLSEGDSVYFDSTMGHALICRREPGLVLWTCTASLPPFEGRPKT